jgi:hypothetical protein
MKIELKIDNIELKYEDDYQMLEIKAIENILRLINVLDKNNDVIYKNHILNEKLKHNNHIKYESEFDKFPRKSWDGNL